jgi:23S rRNA (cytosine1962-C5)-methyltransferase
MKPMEKRRKLRSKISEKTQAANKPSKPSAPASSRRRDAISASAQAPGKTEVKTPGQTLSYGAVINRRAADRLRSGHVWVYASDIESLNLPQSAEETPPLLPMADSRGLLLGTALFSPSSQIALRLISRQALDESGWLELLSHRLRRAIARRKPLLTADNDACRLCFSEADELPGLVVDKYGALVILQLLSKGMLAAGVRETCVRVLREELSPTAIFERPDPRIRELEGMPAPDKEALWALNPKKAEAQTKFHLNGLAFHYDANAGQKTGAFLDQRANYLAARQWVERLGIPQRASGGRALDVCCYQGGFALHLAQVCKQVTGIDASRASLQVAEKNLAANRAAGNIRAEGADVDWIEADAFEILRDWSDSAHAGTARSGAGQTPTQSFDAIVLDPPAFAKTKRAVEGALRGYKELNLRALRMITPGGLLVTCSCSHHVTWAEFESAVASAAADASRRVRLLERRGASPDHPVILTLPETEYLKCLVLEVE